MSENEAESLRNVHAAAELLVSTSPVQMAAALRAHGLDRAADHVRFLGIAVSLARSSATLDAADRAKIAQFPHSLP